jgi:type III secretion system YscQ/HrcQ family protein
MSREQKTPAFILDGEDPIDQGPTADPAPHSGAGVFGNLPKLGRLHSAFGRALDTAEVAGLLRHALAVGSSPEIVLDDPDVRWRSSGLKRPGVIAEFVWPRLETRVALAVDTPLAHAMVDRLLGFDRQPGEDNLQVTPVEWGILTHVAARFLEHLRSSSGLLGPYDLRLDRVGPDPFEPSGLGQICTIRWPVHIGRVTGSLRLWIAEPLVLRAISGRAPSVERFETTSLPDLDGIWRAVVGTVTLSRGLGGLRPGGVLPVDGAPLGGSTLSPIGTVKLMLADQDGRSMFLADVEPGSAGAKIRLSSHHLRVQTPRGPIAVTINPNQDPAQIEPTPASSPVTEIPVTLVVELGRVNLSLGRVADLKPGDIVELGRNPREPVELTSNGRLVARGELVQLDTELAIRLTNVFL